MSKQHMSFEEIPSERSQSSFFNHDEQPSSSGYFPQNDGQKLLSQVKANRFTTKQRGGIVMSSLVLFMVVFLFSSVETGVLSIGPGDHTFAQIVLLSSIFIVFVAIIFLNTFFSLSSSPFGLRARLARNMPFPPKEYEPSPGQRVAVASISLLNLLIVLYTSVLQAQGLYYVPGDIYPRLILIVGSALYFLAAITLNLLFNRPFRSH